jgi:ABC-type phosphate/phosphonate transport system substrate-binding protein
MGKQSAHLENVFRPQKLELLDYLLGRIQFLCLQRRQVMVPANSGNRFSMSFLGALAFLIVGNNGQWTDQPETIHIGIMATFYRDHPEEDVKVTVDSLRDLMLMQTGFKGDPIKVSGVEQLADDLMKDKMQLGVFFGHEFAWIHEKFPDLKPLLIVVNQISYQRCYIFVTKAKNYHTFPQLKGKSLAMPAHTPEPCHLFFDRQCQNLGMDPEKSFSKVSHPDNVEAAIDDVADGLVDAVIVDEMALNSYKRRKPGRFDRLKEVIKSHQFPAAVVAYQPKRWNDADLKTIRNALLDAHKNPEGRQLLTLWRLTGFEPVPDDYDKTLKAILETYPPKNAEK